MTVYAPVGIHVVISTSTGAVTFWNLGLIPLLATSIAIGSLLTVLSYRFSKRGVQKLLSNVKV